ncbi:MAG: hypothetical protein ABIO70_34300 [Pseudomonadota bacterium]
MARSLTVKHDEKLGTSSLLNVFLLLAFACLLLGSIGVAASADGAEPPAAQQNTATVR